MASRGEREGERGEGLWLWREALGLCLSMVGGDAFADVLKSHHIPQIRREELSGLEYDILLSFVYPCIIEAEHLERAQWYAVNLHESPLPRYRGCNGYSHAILENDTTYGTTLHTMEAELDAGEIIDQMIFPIESAETARELYLRTAEYSTQLLRSNLTVLASGSIPRRSMDSAIHPIHARSSLVDLKRIPVDIISDIASVERIARAMDFPPFAPAYFEREGQSHYVFVDGSADRRTHRGDGPLYTAFPAVELPEIFLLGTARRPLVVMEAGRYVNEYPIF